MTYVKINADDLILDYHLVNNDVYTLVCRADINRPDRWNYIPSIDMVRFDVCGNERHMYVMAVNQVMHLQKIKYPQIQKIKQQMQSQIEIFHNTLNTAYNTKTK